MKYFFHIGPIFFCFVGVPLDISIQININDLSSVSEVNMVSCCLNLNTFLLFLYAGKISLHRLELWTIYTGWSEINMLYVLQHLWFLLTDRNNL